MVKSSSKGRAESGQQEQRCRGVKGSSQGPITRATPAPATTSMAWASWPCVSTRSGSMTAWWASSCTPWNTTIRPGAASLWVSGRGPAKARLALRQSPAPTEGLHPLPHAHLSLGPLPYEFLRSEMARARVWVMVVVSQCWSRPGTLTPALSHNYCRLPWASQLVFLVQLLL